MVIKQTGDFIHELKKLPSDAKRFFSKQEAIFKNNWLDPRLHIKRIKELPGTYSFHVTRRYRVIFYFHDSNAVFFSVGHRKDIYD